MALALVALLVALVVWALSMGGGSGNQAGKAGEDDRGDGGAASSITPGPTTSESVPDDRPGGRDEEDDEAGQGGGSAGTGGSDASDDSDGSQGAGSSGGSGGSVSSGAGDASGGAGGDDVRGLAACRAGQARVSLVTVREEYRPGEQPKLRLTVENTSGTDCKVDVNGSSTVLTIIDSDDKTVWASDHCAADGRTELRVGAREKTTHTYTWKRERSAASCATPSGGAPGTGTYIAEVEIPGVGGAQTRFTLAKD